MSDCKIHFDAEVCFIKPDMTLHVRFFDYLGNKILTQDYVPERTCKLELKHSGTLYDVYRYPCCGFEYSESRTDSGATEIPPNYCPNCGAKVVNE